MTNDVPDRIWAFYAPDIAEDENGATIVAHETVQFGGAPFLRATPAREHAEELVEALREIIAKATWENYPTALELMAVIDSFEDIAAAALARIEQEKP